MAGAPAHTLKWKGRHHTAPPTRISHQRLASGGAGAYRGRRRPPQPSSGSRHADPISAHEAGLTRPHETADDHIERDLLSEENRRLKDELRRAEHALKVAAKVLGPYFK
jgi:hypothetical protein